MTAFQCIPIKTIIKITKSQITEYKIIDIRNQLYESAYAYDQILKDIKSFDTTLESASEQMHNKIKKINAISKYMQKQNQAAIEHEKHEMLHYRLNEWNQPSPRAKIAIWIGLSIILWIPIIAAIIYINK